MTPDELKRQIKMQRLCDYIGCKELAEHIHANGKNVVCDMHKTQAESNT